MAIPVSSIKEGCCDNDLRSYNTFKGDNLDSGPTCDIVIECSDKYILVEEKSVLFGFFHLCLKELRLDIDKNYKYNKNGTQYLKISEIISVIQGLSIEVKERILDENIENLLSTYSKKINNMTHILATQRDSNKTHNMQIFYLYCKSGKPIDRIMSTYLSRYRKKIFIECNDLKSYLQNKPECKNV